MNRIIPILRFVAPIILMVASIARNLDADDTGVDDNVATWLERISEIIQMILGGQPLPPAPPALRQ